MPSTRLQLAEAIDRVLHKGAVVRGDLIVSVAGVDLLYLDLRVILSAVDTAMREDVIGGPSHRDGDPTAGGLPAQPVTSIHSSATSSTSADDESASDRPGPQTA
ncbi:gas vesicle protein [Longibacter sp.]|uniref:gas vesicle protein n=1 Tax=Longibacter sp. TaxID=2045415 RepID=UPI003EB88E82